MFFHLCIEEGYDEAVERYIFGKVCIYLGSYLCVFWVGVFGS